MHDAINHPSHYCHGGEETIDKIKRLLTEDEYRGFLKGNMIKYDDRAPYKGETERDRDKFLAYSDFYVKSFDTLDEEKPLYGQLEISEETQMYVLDKTLNRVLGILEGARDKMMDESVAGWEEYESKVRSENVLPVNPRFTYPRVKHYAPNNLAFVLQVAKITEELAEVTEILERGTTVDEIPDAMCDLLDELEDLIHATEEAQKLIMDIGGCDAEEADELKRMVVNHTYLKNKERGYYDDAEAE